jgi:hypothetical protein
MQVHECGGNESLKTYIWKKEKKLEEVTGIPERLTGIAWAGSPW